ncbi:MAG: T9SS type A sorting domain-containing protein [Flavobacteriales bacterium]|nr:T9SS type A sorting domain-containing protein [Flavobacteriales bacterium]
MGAQTTFSIDNLQQVTGDANSGDHAVRLWQPAIGITFFTSEQVHLDSGNYYQVGFWAKGTGIVGPALFDDNSWGGYLTSPNVNVNSATWEYHVREFFCQHTTDSGEVMFIVAITYAPDHLTIDDVTLALNNPPPPLLLSIQQIQTPLDGTDNSPYVGSAVVTSGIVTAINLGGYQFYIQDGTGPYSGVCVSEFTGAALQMGDSVRVTGNVGETGDQETIISCQNGYQLLTSGSPMPAPELLAWPLADLEPWEGVLASVENVTCAQVNGNGSWDGIVNSSADVGVGVLFYTSAVAEGSTYNVTGILHHVWPMDRLEPRVPGDVTEVVGIEELYGAGLQCYPNPANDVVHVQLPDGSQKPFQYELIDATGKVVQSGLAENGQIELAKLSEGLFVLRVLGYSAKLVIRH